MENEKEKEMIKVSIPASLFERLKKQIKTAGFESVEDYVAHLLREALPDEKGSEEPYTKEEEEKVKERLKSLGYLE